MRDLFIGKLSWTITSSTDNLLISALVGTIQVGLYSNYTIVLNTLTNVVNQLSAAMSGSIGNLLATAGVHHKRSCQRNCLRNRQAGCTHPYHRRLQKHLCRG